MKNGAGPPGAAGGLNAVACGEGAGEGPVGEGASTGAAGCGWSEGAGNAEGATGTAGTAADGVGEGFAVFVRFTSVFITRS